MKLKHYICLMFPVAAMLLMGCAGTAPGPGQPFPGALFTDTVTPSAITPDQEFDAYPDRFEILGLTEGTSSNVNLFGLVSIGDGGYISALEDAITRAGADGLINVVADVKSTGFLFIYSSSKTVVRGLAIKRRE